MVPMCNKGVKMFEMAQLNVFTSNLKKGGGRFFRFLCHCWEAMGLGGMQVAGRMWVWSPTLLEVMGVGVFDLAAAPRW